MFIKTDKNPILTEQRRNSENIFESSYEAVASVALMAPSQLPKLQ